ncbi:hypothetical protein B0T24DRAFT_674678 [Lasiosphaeria ovina]|uniref:Uncharacterized protein n=1 Tax=Lasiosphaeria ovina TaxID=92902 RepID=A0AAE0NDH0_9PEZI|nr:hypothetical protein B0T24DRAFT_674678 [Lasiosphaeria ovina]
MASNPKTREFLLDKCRTKYSWISGVTRGTPRAIGRYKKDLEIAFAEINGLMAGMHFQDQADINSEHTYPDEIFDGDLLSSEPVTAVDDQPMASQWAAIRSLREETAFHHKRFQQLATRLNDPVIFKLLDIYPDARSIRNEGAQLVMDVLKGFQPRKLSLVFAFTCFSYSISQLLHKKGRLDKADILADIKTWRDMISDSRERQAFNRLAPELWPEAKDHLHFIDIPEHLTRGVVASADPSSRLAGYAGSAEPPIPQHPYLQPLGSTIADQNGTLDFTDSFNFNDTAPDANLQDIIISEEIVRLLALSHEVNNYAAIGAPVSQPRHEGPPDTGWPPPIETMDPTYPGRLSIPSVYTYSPGAESESSQLGNDESKDPDLKETIMFLVVFNFLQDMGQLLYILSGRSLTSRCYELYRTEQEDQEAFYMSAQEAFFKPCYQDRNSGFPAAMALLSVAETFTKNGYLRSIAEIKHYLVGFAAAVFPPGAAFEQFLSSILQSVPVPAQAPALNRARKRQMSADEELSSPDYISSPRATK